MPPGRGMCAGLSSAKEGSPRSLTAVGHAKILPHGDIAHAVENKARVVGKTLRRALAGNAGENKHGIHAGFHPRDDIGIHPVANHGCIGTVHAEELDSCAHHQRIGLADKIGRAARRKLNWRDKSAAGPE